ncbi:unnamed protein product [Caenorhabditis bovis]|uniref:Peptidase M14 domain-containing protein n=2 Tax=Caenorhabditis bovis TaxID=2654633 RepID=A0A8S1EAR4_9PELO|nr:unnamed protein product [Caenorhabditis bovis]
MILPRMLHVFIVFILICDVAASSRHIRRRRFLDIGIEDVRNHYLAYNDQISFLRTVQERNPDKVEILPFGHSYEMQPLYLVKITNRESKNTNKKKIWIDAGIHGREWVASSAAIDLIYELANNPEVEYMLNNLELLIVPNLNPDGYMYSSTGPENRMWRKTRSRQGQCFGVDGNRNYPIDWARAGTSNNSCSDTFGGDKPYSEIEVYYNIQGILSEMKSLRGYVSFHAYGEQILYPYGYAFDTYPEDVEDLIHVANKMSTAIKNDTGVRYKVINSADMYPASGASDDWAKSIGIKYTFTIELSPKSDEINFKLPTKELKLTHREAYVAIRTLMEHINSEV